MGVGIAELRESLGEYAAGFDAAVLSAAQAAEVVEQASRIEKMAATVKALAAARVAESGSWRSRGRPVGGPLTWPGARARPWSRRRRSSTPPAGSSPCPRPRPPPAGASCRPSRRPPSPTPPAATPAPSTTCWRRPAARPWPSCASSAPAPRPRPRSISRPAAAASTNAARFAPTPTPRANGTCTAATTPRWGPASWPPSTRSGRRSSARLGPRPATSPPRPTPPTPCPRWPAAQVGRMRPPHRSWSGADAAPTAGTDASRLAGTGVDREPPTGAEAVGRRAAPERPRQTADRGRRYRHRRAGRNRRGRRYRHPGACSSAESAPRAGTPKVIVRVDLEALLRGYPIEGEVCEIAGFGPVAVSAVRDMIDTDDPFLAAVATRGEKLVGVAHLGRRPNALQQTALQWLYPSCANESCSAQARLDYDHRARLVPHPSHRPRPARPSLPALPRPQDEAELVPGRGPGQTGARPAGGPSPSGDWSANAAAAAGRLMGRDRTSAARPVPVGARIA